VKKRSQPKKGDAKRLFEILGEGGHPAPSSLKEARMLAEMAGAQVQVRQGLRLDNNCMKTCYTSESQAKQAARRRVSVSSNVGKLRAYYCDVCKHWHMTSSFHIGNK
jgi:hypothetical protein